MGVYQTVENRLKGFFHAVVAVWLFFFAMTSVIMIFVMPSSSAHSMLRTADVVLTDLQSSELHDQNSSSKVQAPDTSDPCLSLIHSGRTSSNNNNGVYAMNQVRSISAGTTAAIGLMLGARYAIQPQAEHETVQMYHDASVSDVSNQKSVGKDVPRTTLSIAAYRQCKKEFALKALNSK